MAMAVMVEVTIKDEHKSLGSDYRVFGFSKDPEALADKLALYALENNQWAEVLTLVNEKLNDADWRMKNVVETF